MTSRTKIVGIILSVVVVFGLWFYSSRPATAQNFSSPMITSVGLCDPHQAFQEYLKVKELRDGLRAQSDRLRQDLEAKQQQIRQKTEELTASQFVPGSEEFERMRDVLVKLNIEAESFGKISEAELRYQDMRITQIGYNDIYAAIAEVAKKKQYTVVLSQEQFSLAAGRPPDDLVSKLYYRRPVLYADQSLDITAEVVELLNTKYKLGR